MDCRTCLSEVSIPDPGYCRCNSPIENGIALGSGPSATVVCGSPIERSSRTVWGMTEVHNPLFCSSHQSLHSSHSQPVEELDNTSVMGSPSLLLFQQPASAGENMLQVLNRGLSPVQIMIPCCLQDPILVSIDVGLCSNGALDTVGVACLDTRKFADSRKENLVSSRLFLLRRRSLPSNHRTRQYLFGISEHTSPEAMQEFLLTIFFPPGSEHSRPRNIFLVGHDIAKDIKYLRTPLTSTSCRHPQQSL